MAKELPAFIDDLLHWKVPREIRSDRFGVRAYHDPEVMAKLYEMSSENQLAQWIESALMPSNGDGTWCGTAEELRRELCQDHRVGRDAEKLLKYANTTGTLLGNLQKKEPGGRAEVSGEMAAVDAGLGYDAAALDRRTQFEAQHC